MSSFIAGPQTINVNVPEPCVVCAEHDSTLAPVLLPWRTSEGWWCCKACTPRLLETRMYPTMNARRVIPTGGLPEWFRNIDTFQVRRTNGELTEMCIVDFKCTFSQNKDNGAATDGRVRLSGGRVYIDMCDPSKTYFKQVTVDNLYANNPQIAEYGIIEIDFPPYVSEATQAEWRAAMLAVATVPAEPEVATVPAEPETAPAEPETAPTEPETAPTEPETAPAEPETAPAEPQTAAVPETAPAEPETAPAEAETAPAEPAANPDDTLAAPREVIELTIGEATIVETASFGAQAATKPQNAQTVTRVPPRPSFW